MILSCPSCSARFAVDAGALRPSGRTVKCGKCAHQWREDAPPPDETPAVGDVADDLVPPPLDPPQSFRRRANLPALPQPRKRRRSGAAAALVASIILVAAGILWLGRAPLTEIWPPAGALYAAVGLGEGEEKTFVPGEGLEVDPVTPRRETDAGVPYLVIEGEVVNVSEVPREVPRMIAILSDAEDVQIQNWTFAVDVGRLGPGERVPFSTRLANPSERATAIKIVFTGSPETR